MFWLRMDSAEICRISWRVMPTVLLKCFLISLQTLANSCLSSKGLFELMRHSFQKTMTTTNCSSKCSITVRAFPPKTKGCFSNHSASLKRISTSTRMEVVSDCTSARWSLPNLAAKFRWSQDPTVGPSSNSKCELKPLRTSISKTAFHNGEIAKWAKRFK